MKTAINLLTIILIASSALGQSLKHTNEQYDINDQISIDGRPFYEYIQRNLTYPTKSRANKIIGTYIAGISIAPDGSLAEVFTINSLDEHIDKSFKDIVQAGWKKGVTFKASLSDTLDIILPIQYMLDHNNDKLSFHVDEFKGSMAIAETVTVVGYATKSVNNGAESPVEISLTSDEKLLNAANRYFEDKKYQKSLPYLNELIRRNPFNGDLFYMRLHVYQALQEFDDYCKDHKMLTQFLEDEKYLHLGGC